MRSENNIGLHVKEVEKRGPRIKIGENEYLRFSDLDTFKNSIIKELKKVNFRDLEDIVYSLQLTYDAIIDFLDVKYITGSTKGYTLPPGIFEISDNIMMLKSLLPDEAKKNISIDDIRLKTNLTTKKTIRVTKRSFFYVILGFTKSHSGPPVDFEGFIQMIPDTCKSYKPVNINGIDENHLKSDCIQGSIVNSIHQAILYSFALRSPPGHKINKDPRIKIFLTK